MVDHAVDVIRTYLERVAAGPPAWFKTTWQLDAVQRIEGFEHIIAVLLGACRLSGVTAEPWWRDTGRGQLTVADRSG